LARTHRRQAGRFGKWGRVKTPYDQFMESEGIPCFRDIGISKVQNLPLLPWKRLGGRGTYIQLHGTESKWGCYLVEVPGRGALNPEKHLFEKSSSSSRGAVDRGLAGRRLQAPHLRVAARLAVFDSDERVPPHRQCGFRAGAAARRHDGASGDEHACKSVDDFQLPDGVPRPLLKRRRLLQIQ
jgi:hypothetical protein